MKTDLHIKTCGIAKYIVLTELVGGKSKGRNPTGQAVCHS